MIDVARDFERMRDYAVGRMSDDERSAFEDRLARDPELVRELEQSLQLREGLQQLEAQGYFAQSAPTGAGARARGLRTSDWLPALAAAAVGALALFLWVQPRSSASGVLQASVDSAVVSPFRFVATRSASLPGLDLPSRGAIDFQVMPAAHATVSSFRVRLLREGSDTPLGAVGSLTPDASGYIHAYADSSRLTAGAYRLVIDPDTGASAAPESFDFRLNSPAAVDR